MECSVVLCTYNRASSLDVCLASLGTVVVPPGIEWELVLVDNASTDMTKLVCERHARALPLRYIYEPLPGQSQARNTGIASARGELLVFTDDDVTFSPGWLASFLAAASRFPDVAFFGGRIVPKWEEAPAPWLAAYSSTKLSGMCVHYDLGEEERRLTAEDPSCFGANMAFRREFFSDGLGFRTDLGLTGSGFVRGEDAALLSAARERGCSGAYVPSALLYHHNPRSRMTERYLREWFMGDGIAAARFGWYPGERRIAAVPLYVWKRLVASTLGFLATRWFAPVAKWLPLECDMARTWGIVTELRRAR